MECTRLTATTPELIRLRIDTVWLVD